MPEELTPNFAMLAAVATIQEGAQQNEKDVDELYRKYGTYLQYMPEVGEYLMKSVEAFKICSLLIVKLNEENMEVLDRLNKLADALTPPKD